MKATSCKPAILAAAEQTLAEQGFAATSLRQITAAAGVNLAAVNYHFGTKAALISLVLQQMFTPLVEERLRNLEQITAGGRAPLLEELLKAYYVPFFQYLDDREETGKRRRQIFSRLASEPDQEVRAEIARIFGPIAEKYFSAFRQAVPHLSDEEFAWRFQVMHGVVTMHFTDALSPMVSPSGHERASGEQSFAWLLTYLCAAWRAGVTTAEVVNLSI
ncbi:TetR/AcrR family transcriptional regulator [Dictyobacter arantiisoli]|uniref:TetR family transcriptional regulator n=1 Tax=Dictyobacter arantiisoli TaxID=2014874 RepID=A0A5A5TE39_9CHLR|nr:TetR/AcrR family transcriptional regulator [Dictyobacter arantiisoli]GCF09821.1 TetR family transcriptional regulator [Dictyobacter arantiisoli]